MAEATFEVNKYKAIKSLNDLRAESAKCADQAHALEDLVAEENRDMTEEENAAFTGFLADSEAYLAKYHEELLADQRAGRRAALEEVRGKIHGSPSAMQVMSRGALSRVTHLHDRILDDPKRGFHSVGDFFQSVYQAYVPGQPVSDERLLR